MRGSQKGIGQEGYSTPSNYLSIVATYINYASRKDAIHSGIEHHYDFFHYKGASILLDGIFQLNENRNPLYYRC